MKTELKYKFATLVTEYNKEENGLLVIQLRLNETTEFLGCTLKNVEIIDLKKISDAFLELYRENK